MRLWALWANYWFRPGSLFDLAVVRILAVGFQVFWLVAVVHERLRDAADWPDSLYDPLLILQLLVWPVGWDYRPPVEVLEVIYWVTVVAGVLALIGLKTKSIWQSSPSVTSSCKRLSIPLATYIIRKP